MSGGDVEAEFASVAIPIPSRRLFTYKVGEVQRATLSVGSRVRVSFGPRRVIGTVVAWPAPAPPPDVEAKTIESVLADAPPVDPPLLALTRFAADYYLCSWGDAIEAALPPVPGPGQASKLVRRRPGADSGQIPARAKVQLRTFRAIPEGGSGVPLGRLGDSGKRAVAALARLGLVEVIEAPPTGRSVAAVPSGPPERPRFDLTPAQAAAVARILPAIARRDYAPFLLFGATGSGKTEVYLRAAETTLASGRGVLYLVPEIGLTPLLVSRLTTRFPGEVTVLHSALGVRERHDAWMRVRRGEARFVVGARSAVFAPLRDPGLIVVDEEQDGSYKQEDSPRYNGRDLAVVRAREQRSVLLMGSATPSLESFHHGRAGRYTLLRLGGRVEERPLPTVRIVDMREELRVTGKASPLSRLLAAALAECLERGEQALILRNRRGWATALLCPACGSRVSCTHCSIAMTWHRSARRLRCHYCGLEKRQPAACPNCGAGEMRLLGEGTERIEDELRRVLPKARIARMDRDTVRRKGAHEDLLRRFERGAIDLLVGTQMIAKGHDFPNVTLVGVLSADQALGLPDFRAAERTFQLLTQVSGRAGRGSSPGSVVIQAYDPRHPVLREAAAQDYEAFFDREIEYRRAMRYPPLTAVVELIVENPSESKAAAWAEILGDALRGQEEGKLILAGPGAAPIERLRGRSRQQIIVRSSGRRRLVNAVDRALTAVEGKIPQRAILVDVDPVSLL